MTKTATPWGPATLVERLTVPQRAGEKRFSSVVELLEDAHGERLDPVRVRDGRRRAPRAGDTARA